ncbi:MAG: 2-hydroxyacyl-CoA dehydratase family protein [Bacillota bacterium]
MAHGLLKLGTDLNQIGKKIARGVSRHILHWPLLYSLGQETVRRGLLKFPYESKRMLVDYGMGQIKEAYRRNAVLVWSSAFSPTELYYALGITHFSPEVASAMVASFGFQEMFLKEAESRWWGRDNCAFHRCAMGGVFLDYFPRPRAFCASTHLCDGAVLLFNNLAARYRRPFFLLDTPLKQDHGALNYVVQQLKSIIASLEELSGKKMQAEKLEEAVACAEAARRELEEVNRLRRHPLSPFNTRDAIAYLYLYFNGVGSPVTPHIYNTLAWELKEKINGAEAAALKPPRFRLLWLHMPPIYRNNMLAYLEGKGARAVFEEFSHVYWEPMDPGRPLHSIARRMLSHFGHGPVERRLHAIKTMVERYKVDGVIHFSHWGCRQNCGSVKAIRDFLRREGIPLLLLDGDCIDNRNYAPGQVQTRIDGFLEMLA